MYHEENESELTQEYHCYKKNDTTIFKRVLIKNREKREGSLKALKMNESLN